MLSLLIKDDRNFMLVLINICGVFQITPEREMGYAGKLSNVIRLQNEGSTVIQIIGAIAA